MDTGMSREVMIPLAVVESLVNTQRDFNRELVERLGFYLKAAAEAYKDALNPPVDSPGGPEMSYSAFTDESDDLLHQIESGIISPADVTPAMRRILADTETSIEP